MIDIIKVIILGIVEGITEFLPISSTGHLIVASAILGGLGERLDNLFEIFIQIGAVVAVIVYYRADLFNQVRTVSHDENVRRLWVAVLIAFIPAAALGFLFLDAIDAVLFNPGVVGLSLIVGGVIFIVIERRPSQPEDQQTHELRSITLRQALVVGIAQTLALIPGMSRSGASIIGGLLGGMDRKVATQFSFYLAIPTLGGATVYSLVKNLDQLTGDDMTLLLLGAVVSGIVAWFAVDWLLKYISNNNFIPFGYYRILVGVPILLLSLAGVLQ